VLEQNRDADAASMHPSTWKPRLSPGWFNWCGCR